VRAFERQWQRLACAAVLGAMLAFPAGMLLAGRERVQSEEPDAKAAAAPPRLKAEARKHYSPEFLSDPYVLQKHQEIVEALETSCRQSGQNCTEARSARRGLVEREASGTR
jgi:hypothetical protein